MFDYVFILTHMTYAYDLRKSTLQSSQTLNISELFKQKNHDVYH